MKHPGLHLCISTALVFQSGCNRNEVKHEKADPPAAVSRKVSESDLITVKLTPEAETRLGIRTDSVKREKVSRFREYAGDILRPLGNAGDASSTNGARSVFSLLPIMSQTDLIRVAE